MSDIPPPGDKFHQDTSEVQDFLTKIKLGWIRWGNTISTVMLVAAIAWFGWNLWQNKKREKVEKDAAAFLSDSPAVLVAEAAGEHDPKAGALLALHGGDLFLKKSQTEANAEDAQKALAAAEAAYKQVLANAAADPLFRQNAQLGLAQVCESKGDWAGAEAAYDAVIKTPGVLPNLAAMAQARKDLIPALKVPVVYGPEPVKIEDVAPAKTETKDAAPAPAAEAPKAPATSAK